MKKRLGLSLLLSSMFMGLSTPVHGMWAATMAAKIAPTARAGAQSLHQAVPRAFAPRAVAPRAMSRAGKPASQGSLQMSGGQADFIVAANGKTVPMAPLRRDFGRWAWQQPAWTQKNLTAFVKRHGWSEQLRPEIPVDLRNLINKRISRITENVGDKNVRRAVQGSLRNYVNEYADAILAKGAKASGRVSNQTCVARLQEELSREAFEGAPAQEPLADLAEQFKNGKAQVAVVKEPACQLVSLPARPRLLALPAQSEQASVTSLAFPLLRAPRFVRVDGAALDSSLSKLRPDFSAFRTSVPLIKEAAAVSSLDNDDQDIADTKNDEQVMSTQTRVVSDDQPVIAEVERKESFIDATRSVAAVLDDANEQAFQQDLSAAECEALRFSADVSRNAQAGNADEESGSALHAGQMNAVSGAVGRISSQLTRFVPVIKAHLATSVASIKNSHLAKKWHQTKASFGSWLAKSLREKKQAFVAKAASMIDVSEKIEEPTAIACAAQARSAQSQLDPSLMAERKAILAAIAEHGNAMLQALEDGKIINKALAGKSELIGKLIDTHNQCYMIIARLTSQGRIHENPEDAQQCKHEGCFCIPAKRNFFALKTTVRNFVVRQQNAMIRRLMTDRANVEVAAC